ncbi:MAG: hypothetical protein M3253_00460 [Chloroflexota bacterium]|nr:hypothetical protein [Chloroflexota bacterium]
MWGFLRFLLFFVVVVGLLVLVALPALASPVLTQMVRDAGLRADDARVTVGYFDVGLVVGRAERMRIEADGAVLGPARVGGLDLALGGVDLFDRTFQTVHGNMRDMTLVAGGLDVAIDRVEIAGPARAATVTGFFSPQQSIEIIRQSARRIGLTLDDVRLVDDGVRLRLGGFETRATIGVDGGALVLRPQVGPPVLLLQPAPSDPWRLTEAALSRDGLVVSGVVDAAALAEVARGR